MDVFSQISATCLHLAVTQGQFLCTWNLHKQAIMTTTLSKVLAVKAITWERMWNFNLPQKQQTVLIMHITWTLMRTF